MDNNKWKISPKIYHNTLGAPLEKIKLEFGSRKIHAQHRRPAQFYHGQYVDRRGRVKYGYRSQKARTFRYIIPFGNSDIVITEGTLKEPRFWYNGGKINIGNWKEYLRDIPPQELEKICVDYSRRLVRGTVEAINGARHAHWFDFDDPQLIVRGYREDE